MTSAPALKYTTTESIARRLSGRLQVGGGGAPYGKSVVDEHLLEQVGLQIEARVEALLRGIYRLPLAAIDPTNTTARPIVAAIVEKGVICELADVHFFQGEDGNTYGQSVCRQFKAELDAIATRQFLLPGEVAIAEIDDRATNFAAVAPRTPGPAELVEW